ncbi:MAG: type 1 glutamine amidotransferase [Roseovarius sp.]
MKIGILLTGLTLPELAAVRGEYDAFFRDFLDGNGFEFETYVVVKGELPESPDEADGWLVTGSKHGAYEDHEWIPRLEAFLRAVHAAKKPLVGICFGHQIIAQALGGKVVKYPGGWKVGLTEYEIEGAPVSLNAWHQDQVVEPPKEAKVIGTGPDCAVAAMTIGDHILTYQPHPEFDAEVVETLIRLRGPGVVPKDTLASATARLDQPSSSPAIARRIAGHFKKGA